MVCNPCSESTDTYMFGLFKKDKFILKIKLFTVRWFPSIRSCTSVGTHRRPPQQMPPLMVRKPEWRR